MASQLIDARLHAYDYVFYPFRRFLGAIPCLLNAPARHYLAGDNLVRERPIWQLIQAAIISAIIFASFLLLCGHRIYHPSRPANPLPLWIPMMENANVTAVYSQAEQDIVATFCDLHELISNLEGEPLGFTDIFTLLGMDDHSFDEAKGVDAVCDACDYPQRITETPPEHFMAKSKKSQRFILTNRALCLLKVPELRDLYHRLFTYGGEIGEDSFAREQRYRRICAGLDVKRVG
ncbi:hypothetical protein F4774DRAFT_273464 [Daldinia eschscholtzii]|nr:hypothetical protein F4774DRAFT_273464 [Daldinia eschscholtzii]